MPESPDLLQRYSAPTCTLEVVGEPSALSRWTAQPVIKGLRFRLSLQAFVAGSNTADEDPTSQPAICLRGDRLQLASLVATVQAYVQAQLVASSLATDIDGTARNPDPPSQRQRISLQPQGLTCHRLQAEGLISDRDEQSIILSSLQLADLATVIDSFDTQAIALPALATPQQRRQRWWTGRTSMGSAAAVILMAVGVATVAPRVLNDSTSVVSDNLPVPTSDAGETSQPSPSDETNLPENHSAESSYDSTLEQAELEQAEAQISADASGRLREDDASTEGTDSAARPRSTTPPNAASHTTSAESPTRSSPSESPSPQPSGQSAQRSAETASALDHNSDPENATAAAPPTDPLSHRSPNTPSAPEATAAPSLGSATAESFEAASGSATDSSTDAMSLDAAPPIGVAHAQAQAEEVQQFFATRWRPQPDLSESLVYELELNPDGTLGRITPMNRIAILEDNRIALPEPGSVIASASAANTPTLIRLALKPNGQVITENQ